MAKDGKKKVKTSHTLNPVPFIIYDPSFGGEYQVKSNEGQGLSNAAATILNLMGYKKPEEYDSSLLEFTE